MRRQTRLGVELLESRLTPSNFNLQVDSAEVVNASSVVPGENFGLLIHVSNTGMHAYSGRPTIHVHIGPKDLTLSQVVFIPASSNMMMTPGKAVIHVGLGVGQVGPANNLLPGSYSVSFNVWQFGTVGNEKNVHLELIDANGRPSYFTMSGPGTGTLTPTAGGFDLSFSGTDKTSSAMQFGAVTFQLHNVQAGAAMKPVVFPNTRA